MTHTKYLLLLLIVISFAQSSCKKSETTKTKTRSELLTQKPWIIVSWRYNIRGGDWVDNFTSRDACMKDDIFTFKSDQTCTREMGAIACNPDFTQPIIGRWSYQGYEMNITLYNVLLDQTFSIQALNENTMTLSAFGSGITEEVTFQHL
ncbi:lipocalin family protein [Mucilaginibacter sp. HD30]